MATYGEIKATDFDFSWEIQDFSKCCPNVSGSIFSPAFTGHWTKWQLQMCPMTSKDDKTFISIFIKSLNSNEIKVIVNLHLMNNVNQVFHERIATKMTFQRNVSNTWGWIQFINRDVVMNNPIIPLVHDKLIVNCKLSLDAFTSELLIRDKLTKNINSLFLKEQFSDVSIMVEGKKLAAHKNILAARSSVFSAMFSCDMVENNKNNVKITDISYDVMKELLRFIYCGRVEKFQAIAESLLKAADKYDIVDLKSSCEQTIWRTMNVSKACGILHLADMYNCETLKNETLQFVMSNLSPIIGTDEFKKLKNTNPKLLEEIIIMNDKKK